MPSDDLHIFVTNEEPHGFSVMSPQLPGFVLHRNTETELRRDLKSALAFAGAPPGLRIVSHVQLRGSAPGGQEFVIRRYAEDHREERIDVADRLRGMLTSQAEAQKALRNLAPSATGEYVFVCCVPSDTLGWLIAQLYLDHDVLTVSAGVADRMVFTTQLGRTGDIKGTTLTESGLTLETTVGELMTNLPSAAPEHPLLLTV